MKTAKLGLFLLSAGISLVAASLRLTGTTTIGHSLLVLLIGLFLAGILSGFKNGFGVPWPEAWLGFGVALSGIPIDALEATPDQRLKIGYWIGILIAEGIFWLLTVAIATGGSALGKKLRR